MQFTSRDLNIKIIEGVGQFPSLHNNNDNLYERNAAWVQLAEKLKMPEQFLKIRWHSLLHGYQVDVNFEYSKWMNFINRNTERKNKDNWPEFIITEEYLKDDNVEEQEQFVLLDTDEEESNSKPIKSCKEHEEPNKEFKIKNDGESVTDIVESNVSTEPYTMQNDDIQISSHSSERHPPIGATANEEEKMLAVENEENGTCIKNASMELHTRSKLLIAERCEDVIFGELVSAMLKRMDENKKKHIKREIMNILFS